MKINYVVLSRHLLLNLACMLLVLRGLAEQENSFLCNFPSSFHQLQTYPVVATLTLFHLNQQELCSQDSISVRLQSQKILRWIIVATCPHKASHS